MSNPRLAQTFSVLGQYVPTKASIYLKRVGKNISSYFLLSDIPIIIDATNFLDLQQQANKIWFDDRVPGFTGNGYMSMNPSLDIIDTEDSDFGTLLYPIKSETGRAFNLRMRIRSLTSLFRCDVLMDDEHVRTITVTVSQDTWTWVELSFGVPDNKIHLLGIKLKEKGNAIDKLYIDYKGALPIADDQGPDYTVSPYFTVHALIYSTTDNLVPSEAFFIYDYKNSIEDVRHDDWYHFNIQLLDNRLTADFSGSAALVITTTGSTENNFAIWERKASDEYDAFPSLIKI